MVGLERRRGWPGRGGDGSCNTAAHALTSRDCGPAGRGCPHPHDGGQDPGPGGGGGGTAAGHDPEGGGGVAGHSWLAHVNNWKTRCSAVGFRPSVATAVLSTCDGPRAFDLVVPSEFLNRSSFAAGWISCPNLGSAVLLIRWRPISPIPHPLTRLSPASSARAAQGISRRCSTRRRRSCCASPAISSPT